MTACVRLPGFLVLRLTFRQENTLSRKNPAWMCTAAPGWNSTVGLEPGAQMSPCPCNVMKLSKKPLCLGCSLGYSCAGNHWRTTCGSSFTWQSEAGSQGPLRNDPCLVTLTTSPASLSKGLVEGPGSQVPGGELDASVPQDRDSQVP